MQAAGKGVPGCLCLVSAEVLREDAVAGDLDARLTAHTVQALKGSGDFRLLRAEDPASVVPRGRRAPPPVRDGDVLASFGVPAVRSDFSSSPHCARPGGGHCMTNPS